MATNNGSAADSNGGKSKPLVFVSYSHKDDKWRQRFRPHLDSLANDRQLVVWDDRQIEPTSEWYEKLRDVMARASAAVCLLSADYLASEFCTKEEITYLLERRKKENVPVFLFLLRACPWRKLNWLEERQLLPQGARPVEEHPRNRWDSCFANLAELVVEAIDAGKAPCEVAAEADPGLAAVDIERLPQTGLELFGRQRELAILDDAWASEATNVVSLVAWGGVGKSTLVNKWLDGLKADKWRGAQRVLGWSFFSQGTGERATSADQFVDYALRFFNDPDPTQGSPWAKGERLADLARRNKALLILDGLEPLQDRFQGIKDPALERLIEELARDNTGLCVITTRETVSELADFPDSTIARDLEQISPEAGRALLRVKGVRGTDCELERVSEGFGNHALAISLLANWLRAIPGHPVPRAYDIPDLDIPPEKGRHPRRVMAAFAERFGEDSAELEVLRLLGLFDRPATKGAIEALRKPAPIPELTDHVSGLDEAGWLRLLGSLARRAGTAASWTR